MNKQRLERLEKKLAAVDWSNLDKLTDSELEAIIGIGDDETGQWLRSLSDAELEAIANG